MVLSVLIAALASYVALDLASSVTIARGRARVAWLIGGSLAMGVGIWSMHFVAMLAFRLPRIAIAYDVTLLVLSVLVAIAASAIALSIVSRPRVAALAFVLGSLSMGAAISGMHYIGIAAMRMAARYEWDYALVGASILIAVTASFVALLLAFRLRRDVSRRGFLHRATGGAAMGLAISGMHYTAMAAMTFYPAQPVALEAEQLLATSGLAVAVIGTTLLILGIALTGSVVDRALARRVAATEHLQNQQRWLEAVLDLSPTPFLLIEPGTARIVFANAAAHGLAGGSFPMVRSVEEHDARFDCFDSDGNRLRPEDLPGVRAARGERLAGAQLRWRTPAGLRALLVSSDVLPAMHGHPSTVVLAFHDVSQLKDTEAALQRAVRARDEFISVASHELKTPLTSMRMQVQMLDRALKRGRPIEPRRLERMLDVSVRQLDRIVRLVEDMLDISRIATGRLTMTMERADLARLVRETIERFEDACREAGCEIRCEIEEDLSGTLDPFRIEQVVTNLMSNALRYGAGSPIEVSLRRIDPVLAELRIRDRGAGIPEEAQSRIFDRFERGAAGSGAGGLGLGLYIARSILEAHGGSIRVESRPGEGSTFVAAIPLSPEAGTDERA